MMWKLSPATTMSETPATAQKNSRSEPINNNNNSILEPRNSIQICVVVVAGIHYSLHYGIHYSLHYGIHFVALIMFFWNSLLY